MRLPRERQTADGLILAAALLGVIALVLWLRPASTALAQSKEPSAAPAVAAPDTARQLQALAEQLQELSKRLAAVEDRLGVVEKGLKEGMSKAQVADAAEAKRRAEATQQARISNMRTHLQTVRSQLLLYKVQHNEEYPGWAKDAALFVKQLTQYTDISGGVADKVDPTHPYGPYLQRMPQNPLSGKSDVTVVEGATTAFSAPKEDGGWWFNRTTGEFRANLKDAWTDSEGTKLNSL
jgi:general secretion pathway protein G